uniref:Uncharacterized protein n=1 Tax=Arundo donax TaxID=35708 RepID=A0A0A9G0N4_ARUDO
MQMFWMSRALRTCTSTNPISSPLPLPFEAAAGAETAPPFCCCCCCGSMTRPHLSTSKLSTLQPVCPCCWGGRTKRSHWSQAEASERQAGGLEDIARKEIRVDFFFSGFRVFFYPFT